MRDVRYVIDCENALYLFCSLRDSSFNDVVVLWFSADMLADYILSV